MILLLCISKNPHGQFVSRGDFVLIFEYQKIIDLEEFLRQEVGFLCQLAGSAQSLLVWPAQ